MEQFLVSLIQFLGSIFPFESTYAIFYGIGVEPMVIIFWREVRFWEGMVEIFQDLVWD